MLLVCGVCVLASYLLVLSLSRDTLWCRASILSLFYWYCILAWEWLKAWLWGRWTTLSSHLWGEWQLFQLVCWPFCSPIVAPMWWSTNLAFSSILPPWRGIGSYIHPLLRTLIESIWQLAKSHSWFPTWLQLTLGQDLAQLAQLHILPRCWKSIIWIACSISSLVGDCRTKPTLDPNTLDTPSTWSVYHCFLGRSIACVCFLGSSAIKSAITWSFKDNHD